MKELHSQISPMVRDLTLMPSQSTHTYFLEEVLTHMLSHLPPQSLSAISLVSRRFHTLVTTPHAWRIAFSRFFPGPEALTMAGDGLEWHELDQDIDKLQSDKRSLEKRVYSAHEFAEVVGSREAFRAPTDWPCGAHSVWQQLWNFAVGHHLQLSVILPCQPLTWLFRNGS